MDAKLAKTIAKGVSGAIFSLALGMMYKAGKKVDQRIDEHFAADESESEQDD